MYYMPKLSHAMLTALICVVFIALGAKVNGRVLLATNIGAFIFAVMTATILYMLIVQAIDSHTETIRAFMQDFGKLDDEARAAVAYAFPKMHYRMHKGYVREFFEDTDVPVEMFRLFLEDSNQKQIAPERNWNSTERPRWAWLAIKIWLEENDKIHPESAAGSHSWLWVGNSYQHLMAYWMAGRKLTNMTGMEAA